MERSAMDQRVDFDLISLKGVTGKEEGSTDDVHAEKG